MTTMMILCAGVLSRLFFSDYVFFASSHKNTFAPVRKTRQKRENPRHLGWCFYNKRRDFETTRFSFSFLLRTRREKKDTFETRIISSSSEESARFERTQTHARTQNQREREREKDDAFFFFSDTVVCLFCVRIICEDHREREREKTFYHLASDKREEKTLTSSCF